MERERGNRNRSGLLFYFFFSAERDGRDVFFYFRLPLDFVCFQKKMMQLVARVARKGFIAGEDRNFVCVELS